MGPIGKVTLKLKTAFLDPRGRATKPEFELLVNGEPISGIIIQSVAVSVNAEHLLPLVTVSFIPRELEVDLDPATVAMIQRRQPQPAPADPGPIPEGATVSPEDLDRLFGQDGTQRWYALVTDADSLVDAFLASLRANFPHIAARAQVHQALRVTDAELNAGVRRVCDLYRVAIVPVDR